MTFTENNPEDNVVVRKQGKIFPYQLDPKPYDVSVESGGYSYHLIFGKQVDGMFLCIPNRDIGYEISDLSEWSWNSDSLLKTVWLYYKDVATIA